MDFTAVSPSVDWPLVVAIVTAVVAMLGWLHERFAFRGPSISLENDVTNQEKPQHAVVLPFERHPQVTKDLFPEYSRDLKYALARAVWLNLGDRAGAVYVKEITAVAEGYDPKCSWYSYVSVPPDSAHAEPILIRGLPDDREIPVTLKIEFEWLRIKWWSRGKRDPQPGLGQVALRAFPPPVPLDNKLAVPR
jgi:hypothetical protein